VKHYKQWQRGTYREEEDEPEADAWLLPDDDGYIDPVAIEVAVHGLRPICMTQAEREVAASIILDNEGNEVTLLAHLSLPSAKAARELAAKVREPETEEDETPFGGFLAAA
jgi:hypothetical protein